MTVQGAARDPEGREEDADIHLKNLHSVQDDSFPPHSPKTVAVPVNNNSPLPFQSPTHLPSSQQEEPIREVREPLLDSGNESQQLSPDVTLPPDAEGEEEEEDDGIPYDRGWAWMVVFGMFVNFILLAGYLKSSGLIFVELLKKFNAPATQTALLFAVRAGVFSLSGFYVMTTLLGHFGSRCLVVTGGVLMALSAILSSLANNLALLICLHSVLLGVGCGLLISPGEVLLGKYFKKRRSLALGLAKCGASIGNVAVPPLLTYLLSNYGLTGTLLLYGGLCLHSIPAALLHRPVSYFSKRHRLLPRPKIVEPKSSENTRAIFSTEKNGAVNHCGHDTSSLGSFRVNSLESQCFQKTLVVETLAPDKFAKHQSPHDSYLRSQSQEMPFEIVSVEECDASMLGKSHPEFSILSSSLPSPRKRSMSEVRDSRPIIGKAIQRRPDLLQAISQSSVMRYMSASSLDVISSTMIPQVSQKDAKQTENHDLNSQDISLRQRVWKSLSRCPRIFIFKLDFSLCHQPLFLLLMSFILFFPFVNMTLDYLPAMATENGVSESRSALLLSVIGGVDFLSRLSCGFIADLKLLRVSTMIAIGFSILGIAVQFVGFMSSFGHFVGLAVLQGVFGGVANCLFAVLVIDFVGLENMGKGIGFCQLVSGVSMAAAYPFLAYIRDVTGSYAMTYHVIGLGTLIAAALAAAEGPVRRLQERRQEHQRQLKNNNARV